MSELIFQILFKWILCGDMDTAPRNFGLIVVNGESIECAPCFDMELLFDELLFDDEAIDIVGDTQMAFRFLNDIAPNILKKFVERAKFLRDSGKIQEIMTSSLPISSFVYDKYLRKVLDRVDLYLRKVLDRVALIEEVYNDCVARKSNIESRCADR